ncbi:hypothetical protein RFI_11245 [Reticulomyxa filosa]|uniref:Uncharacterized protein n=1 Tax=Reticulomyxa filosa TaxID=46433 RepID=X6NKM3_RETFI|nr:hypothetical protein RFI_11245 [Reticulomyxa filosa]|eukprot:ETO25892.1 hypothetical protein RFI_11245 [Reticulomyxa filosa]
MSETNEDVQKNDEKINEEQNTVTEHDDTHTVQTACPDTTLEQSTASLQLCQSEVANTAPAPAQCEETQTIHLQHIMTIQCYVRMCLDHIQKHTLLCSIRIIQRNYRGFRVRKYVYKPLRQFHEMEILSYRYNSMAILIQRRFRGFICRKYQLNYYSRKQYLLDIQTQSNLLLTELNNEQARKIKEQAVRDSQLRKEKFQHLMHNMHHLLSTASRPGVFSCPFDSNLNTKALGEPVETHIKKAFHNKYQNNSKAAAMFQNVSNTEKSVTIKKKKTSQVSMKHFKNKKI